MSLRTEKISTSLKNLKRIKYVSLTIAHVILVYLFPDNTDRFPMLERSVSVCVTRLLKE